VTASITRAQLLSRGAKGSAALLVAGTALTQFADAASADAPPVMDLAYARLLVGAELLASDFYSQAIAASIAGGTVTRYLKRAYVNEQEHYQSLAGFISGTLNTPAVSGDITFSYPDGTFATQASIVSFAAQLEATILGSYLGAVVAVQTPSLKTSVSEIAACEAQHSSYFTTAMGGKAFDLSFPPALTIDVASDALDAYTS
jgi:Ferritin-like domain